MRIEQLECLVDIAQTGSLTATADRMFVSQPAVSKSIRQLEDELGVEILVRTNTGVQLTTVGQKVVSFAKEVLEEKKRLSDEIQNEISEENKYIPLKICSASPVINFVIPDIINDFRKRANHTIFQIDVTDDIEHMIGAVQKAEYDIGLFTINAENFPKYVSNKYDNLYFDIVSNDKLIALSHKRFIQNSAGTLSPKEMREHPLTVYNIKQEQFAHMRDAFGTYTMCSNDAEFHRNMMEKNGAIVLMPALAQQYFFKSKQLTTLKLSTTMPLLHVAVRHDSAHWLAQDIIALIRRKMQLQ